MRIYLINLERRPDRLAAMAGAGRRSGPGPGTGRGAGCGNRRTGMRLTAGSPPADPWARYRAGDKACLLSHRAAWERFVASGDAHAVFLEDDVRLSGRRGRCWRSDAWIPAGVQVVKLEHYGPPGQRVLLADHACGRGGFPDGPDAVAPYRRRRPISCRARRRRCCWPNRASTCRWIICCSIPTIRSCSRGLRPGSFCRPSPGSRNSWARNPTSKTTRAGLRAFGWTYVRRELVRFGYDLKLLPRQAVALIGGAKFVAIKTADCWLSSRQRAWHAR